MDEKKLEAVEERLDSLNRLKRKYGGSLDAVFEKLTAIDQDLSGIENIAEPRVNVIPQTPKSSRSLCQKGGRPAGHFKDVKNQL
jgi:DNA repair protein RecN (Recombination protein N)